MIKTTKSILIIISLLGVASSAYGYHELVTIVSAFADILAAFETNLSAGSKFIIQTYNYYGLFSIIGLVAFVLALLNKVSEFNVYILIISNVLLMFSVKWLTENELNHSILTMGVIQ